MFRVRKFLAGFKIILKANWLWSGPPIVIPAQFGIGREGEQGQGQTSESIKPPYGFRCSQTSSAWATTSYMLRKCFLGWILVPCWRWNSWRFQLSALSKFTQGTVVPYIVLAWNETLSQDLHEGLNLPVAAQKEEAKYPQKKGRGMCCVALLDEVSC